MVPPARMVPPAWLVPSACGWPGRRAAARESGQGSVVSSQPGVGPAAAFTASSICAPSENPTSATHTSGLSNANR